MKNSTREQIQMHDPIDLAIWKYMSDGIGRTLRAIGEGLSVHGFNQRAVRDRVSALFRYNKTGWFNRKTFAGGRDPVFTLKPNVVRPKDQHTHPVGFIPTKNILASSSLPNVVRDKIENEPSFKNLDLSNTSKAVAKIAERVYRANTFTVEDIRQLLVENIPEEFDHARGDVHPHEFTRMIISRAVTEGGIIPFNTNPDSPMNQFTVERYVATAHYTECWDNHLRPASKEIKSSSALIIPKEIQGEETKETLVRLRMLANDAFSNEVMNGKFTATDIVNELRAVRDKKAIKELIGSMPLLKVAKAMIKDLIDQGTIREFDIHLIDPTQPTHNKIYVLSTNYDRFIDEHIATMEVKPNKETKVTTQTTQPKILTTDSTLVAVEKALEILGPSKGSEVIALIQREGHRATAAAITTCLSRHSSDMKGSKQHMFRMTNHTADARVSIYGLKDLHDVTDRSNAFVDKPELYGTKSSPAKVEETQTEQLETQPEISEETTVATVTETKVTGIPFPRITPLYEQFTMDVSKEQEPKLIPSTTIQESEVKPSFTNLDSMTEFEEELIQISVRLKGQELTSEQISELISMAELMPNFNDFAQTKVMVSVGGTQISYDELIKASEKLTKFGWTAK